MLVLANNIYGYSTTFNSWSSSRFPETSADSLPEEQEPLTLTINSKGRNFYSGSKS